MVYVSLICTYTYSVHKKSGGRDTETVKFYVVITSIGIEQITDVNGFYID